MIDKLCYIFDDHGKKLIYGLMGSLVLAMVCFPLFGAIEAAGWNV